MRYHRKSPIVDPSEILVDVEEGARANAYLPNPWARFFARFFDYAWFLLLLWGGRALLHGSLPFGRFESFIPFEFFVWIPLEALLLSLWGTTPGKWFLQVKLRQGRRLRLAYASALKRSFSVWLRGLGMMIPIISFFCLLVAYQRLKIAQHTSWDRDDGITVTNGSVPKWRFIASTLFIVAVFLVYFSSKR